MKKFVCVENFKFSQLLINVFFLFGALISSSQNFNNYSWPIDPPFELTGNYGELRPNHFHAGLDFSTRGQINLPIYSVEEGYVSRIRINTGGYGKCVYITHPDGKVTLYAHLNSFSLKIDNVVKKQQFDIQSYEVEVLPRPRTVYVRKGEIIGLSGNTGGSTGPHLHFEIRDEKSETPLNPLHYFKIRDVIAPEMHHMAFYNLVDTLSPKYMRTFKVTRVTNDSLQIEDDHIVVEESIVGLAFSALDRLKPSGNPNNVFSADVYLDDQWVYNHKLNHIDFLDGRYCNEFSEVINGNKFQKCFIPTVYPPGFYYQSVNKGRLVLNDSVFRKVKLILRDESGNKTVLQWYMKSKNNIGFKKSSIKTDFFVNCTKDVKLKKDNLSIIIPARTFYYSTELLIENNLANSQRFYIGPKETNLASACIIGFQVPLKFGLYADKLLLKNKSSLFVPVTRKDSVFFSVKTFGTFELMMDTIPPQIKMQLSERKLKEAWNMDSFSFIINDNLSGIAKYKVWLNNEWVLAEYNSKTDLLTYYFDENTPMGLLQFKVEITDRVGNKKNFEYLMKR